MDLLTTNQVAERLGVVVSTIHRWVDDGTLTPATKLPGKTGVKLFDPAEVDRFLAEREGAA